MRATTFRRNGAFKHIGQLNFKASDFSVTATFADYTTALYLLWSH
jgi:hypothetical protein